MRKISVRKSMVAMSVVVLAASPVWAGYQVTTGVDAVLTPAGALPGAQPGDVFSTTTSGTFVAYAPDTAADLQITGGDLNFFRYQLAGTVLAAAGNVVNYGGTYNIFYDLNLNGAFDALSEPTVSTGAFTLDATFTGAGSANLAGVLTQLAGPSNPAFGDLSYGGNPVVYAGTYVETNPGVSGTIQGTLTQSAAIPEPALMGLLAPAAALLGRRRK